MLTNFPAIIAIMLVIDAAHIAFSTSKGVDSLQTAISQITVREMPSWPTNLFASILLQLNLIIFSITLCLKKGTPTLSTVTLERINGF